MNSKPEEQADLTIYATIFQNITSQKPIRQKLVPWNTIASMLIDTMKRSITPDKHSVPLISFAKFHGTRALKNIEYVSAVVLDFDDGTPFGTVLKLGKDIEFVAYSTHSHAIEKPKFRIVAPLARRVKTEEYLKIWTEFNRIMGGSADQNAKDASRINYLPSCPEEKAEIAFAYHNKGEFIDPDKLVSATSNESSGSNESNDTGGKPDMTQGYANGQRTIQLTRRAGWCLGPEGLSKEETITACMAWNEHNRPPLPKDKVRDTVRNIAKREANNLLSF